MTLTQLPVEILLRIIGYLDNETLINLYEISRLLYYVIFPQLRETYRVKVVDLGAFTRGQEIDIQRHLIGRRTLKFVEELIFEGYWSSSSGRRHCSLHERGVADELGRALMPVFRGLRRHGLLMFRWNLVACVPHQILGPRGYLRRHQRNIKCLSLKTTLCIEHADPSRQLSIARFHNIRSFSWMGINTINHYIALTQFFAANAHRLEKLRFHVNWHPHRLARWKDLQKDWTKARNFFAFKILQLQEGSTQCLFPKLRQLTLGRVEFQYAWSELAYAFQLHKLHALELSDSWILQTIADIAEGDTIPLTSLNIRGDERENPLEPIQQFLALSIPDLEDVFIRIDCLDQTSLTPHLRSIFTTERKVRRFIYERHLYVVEDVAGEWEPTLAPMVWDTGIIPLTATLQCVGLVDHLPSLRFQLSKHPPMAWEILHIRSLSTVHEEYHPHNPTFDLPNDFDTFFKQPPTSLVDFTAYGSEFTPDEITDFLSFANWAFGPRGLPKLDLLVFGQVTKTDWAQALASCIFLTRNTEVATRVEYPYRQVGVGDEDIRRRFEDNVDFFTYR